MSSMSNGVIAPSALAVPSPTPAAPSPPANANANARPSSEGMVNQNGKRELSPDRSGPPNKTIKSSHGEDVKPIVPTPNATSVSAPTPAPSTSATGLPNTTAVPAPVAPFGLPSNDKKGQLPPMVRGQGFDMRAEDEAARRAVRSTVGNVRYAGLASRARQTDLFGEKALRKRLNDIGKDHNVTVEDEAMRYLALAAEIRVRSLLESSIRVQQHRVNSTHQHKPPMTKPPGGKGPAQALWSQKITSDTYAVMQALTNANRDENKAHRVARTERNARETEMARAAAIQREREGGSSPPPAVPDAGSSTGPASEAEAGASTSTPRPVPAAPVFQSSPTFGAPIPKKTGKGKKAARDVSADVQAKMTNTTAAFLAGGRKRYAWETGGMGGAFRPAVPSLLSGKRKKGAEEEKEKKKKEEEEAAAAEAAAKEAAARPPKRPKRTVTGPHRRVIDIETPGDRLGRDDTALTVVDMLFALEREGSGRGPGTTEDITRRFWTRPGGPYGKW